MMPELKLQYSPKQLEFREAVESFPVTFYGGAKGGGKSHGGRNIVLERRFKHPGSVGAIFRKTYPELEKNHIAPMFAHHPELKTYYNQGKHVLSIPVHDKYSSLNFCYCENDHDLDAHQGAEYHDMLIDEVGNWHEHVFRTLYGCNRSSIAGISPRTMLTGNPGGIGHKWLKRLFVDRDYRPNEDSDDYFFIQAFVRDNPFLMENDPNYLKRLESETNELLRKAYLEGIWDLQAGQYFSELCRDVHVIKPFTIPTHWRLIGVYDHGYSHPASFGWFALDEEGNMYLYRAYLQNQKRPDEIAEILHSFPDTKRIHRFAAGGDCWATGRDGNRSIAKQFADLPKHLRINFQRAKMNRVQGAGQLRQRIAWRNLPDCITGPKLFFFDTPDCMAVFNNLIGMVHDPHNPEDVLKIDATEGDVFSGDDPYDMIRYAVMEKPLKTKPAEKQDEQKTVNENRIDRVRNKRKAMKERWKNKTDSVLGDLG